MPKDSPEKKEAEPKNAKKRPRPPPIDTSRAVAAKIERSEVQFSRSFSEFVVDLFLARHWSNQTLRRVGARGLTATALDAARLHTIPFAFFNDQTYAVFTMPSENLAAFQQWTAAFIMAGLRVAGEVKALRDRVIADIASSEQDRNFVRSVYDRTQKYVRKFLRLRNAVVSGARSNALAPPVVKQFVRAANNYPGNVYTLGKHSGVNIQVSARLHANLVVKQDGDFTMTPISKILTTGLAGLNLAIPLSPRGTSVVGQLIAPPIAQLSAATAASLDNLLGRREPLGTYRRADQEDYANRIGLSNPLAESAQDLDYRRILREVAAPEDADVIEAEAAAAQQASMGAANASDPFAAADQSTVGGASASAPPGGADLSDDEALLDQLGQLPAPPMNDLSDENVAQTASSTVAEAVETLLAD